MSKHYKIHPGIGIARVGKSESGFFLASETRDGEPFELSDDGEIAFSGYKDEAFLIRRQGARFRVFEYERNDSTGESTFVGEITPDKATIRWSVTLGSRKAAGPMMARADGTQGERIIVPGNGRRNDSIDDRSRLATEASLSSPLEGINQPFESLNGSIMEQPVLLGECRTDFQGRLVVLGGKGKSASWQTPMAPLPSYLNNNGWFDDIADGPVDAELVFPDGTTTDGVDGSWVIVAPPDFAPGIHPFVSLYDLIFDSFVQSGRLPHPTEVSYKYDILPILERAANLRWVNRKGIWRELAEFLATIPTLNDPNGSQTDRQDVFDTLLRCESDLDSFRLTRTQKDDYLSKWVQGEFISDSDSAPPLLNPAEELDRNTLSRCIGSGLFPGIEIGYLATNSSLYAEFGRFTRGQFNDFNGLNTLRAGSASERMALPWQADFMECETEWWPVQRPDTALFREDGTETPADFLWDRNVREGSSATHESHFNMVQHFAQLGVVDKIEVEGEIVYAEIARDPNL